ncbi:MAG TPA: glycosyltransferase [Pirellulaceae bacterium]|nr:glycosyltransferase [Pirellulaceae bacterium]
MTQSIVVVVPTFFPLGPLFQFLQVVPFVAEAGFDLHVTSCRNESIEALIDRFPQITFHVPIGGQPAPNRNAILASVIADVRPVFAHNWMAGPRIGRWLTKNSVAWLDTSLDPRWWQTKKSPIHWHGGKPVGTVAFAGPDSIDSCQQTLRDSTERWSLHRSVHPSVIDRLAIRQLAADLWGIPLERRMIVAAAPLVPATRHKDLIWALDLLNCIRDDLHLLILGDGSQRQRLLKFAESTAARNRVTFGANHQRVLDLIACADVYWHGHLGQWEPDGLLWAMAHGVPVVSAWGPATQGIVRYQQTGLGVELGRRDQFARWTKYILEQEESAQRMVAQGRQWVSDVYNPQDAANELVEVYRSVVEAIQKSTRV